MDTGAPLVAEMHTTSNRKKNLRVAVQIYASLMFIRYLVY
jgi:hypothetical protein